MSINLQFPDQTYTTDNKPQVETIKADFSTIESAVNTLETNSVTLTGSNTLTNKTLTSPVINGGLSGTAILDEDTMTSNSATKVPTQQSVKAYIDTHVADTTTHGTTGNIVGTSDTQELTNKTLTSPVINTAISGTAIASGAEVTTGTDDTQIVTPKALGDAGVNTRLKSKIIVGTRDMTAASGDVSYTGVGFIPTAILCMTNIDNTGTSAYWSMGVSDSAIAEYSMEAGDDEHITQQAKLIHIEPSAGAIQSAVVKTYDADGFTLTWTKTNSPTGTAKMTFLCFR